MAQYPIPQFIESEAKIISFLTFKQFFTLVSGGAVIAILFYTVPFAIFAIASICVALLVAAIAFLKIDNISAVTFVLNLISFTTKSKNYTWKKKEMPYPFKVKTNQEVKEVEGLHATETEPSGLKGINKIVEFRKKV